MAFFLFHVAAFAWMRMARHFAVRFLNLPRITPETIVEYRKKLGTVATKEEVDMVADKLIECWHQKSVPKQ